MGFLFGGHNTTTRADRIADFQINSASYGEVVPEVLGTTRLSGNVIYWDDFTAHEHRHTQRTGKGGGSSTTQIDYTYTVAVAIALCEGPIAGIGRVWRDKEIYHYPQQQIQLSLYSGALGQAPWPYVTSKHPEKALPYSGLTYMAGVLDLGNQGGLPNFNFEVKGKLLNTGDGVDVNPADYILHVLKGIGISESDIAGLDNYRRYCAAADLLISTPPDGGAKKAQEIVNEIADITNAYVYWSHDKLKIVPLADKAVNGWTPDTEIKYDLTVDDFLPQSDGALVIYRRKNSTECYNQATVEFINRANGYEKEAVSFEVISDVQRNGLRPAPSKTCHYIYTKKRAQAVAEQQAMKQLYMKNQYSFKLDWAFCRLEPGDLVTLTDEASQLQRRVVVITEVSEAEDGELTITAVGKPPGTYSPARYDVHENERPFVDYNESAPSVTDVMIIQPPADVGTETALYVGVAASPMWGGCNVWLSDNNEAYVMTGTIKQQARIGRLTAPMTATDTTCRVRLTQGLLRSGTHIDAERGNTLCWVDGECFSYEVATVQSDSSYILTGLVRGQYNTQARAHNTGMQFARLDEAFMRYPYRAEDVGKTIYLKFTSLNRFGGNEQDLSIVDAHNYTIQQYYIPDVTALTLTTRYHDLGRGARSYDLVATFTVPTLGTYDTTDIEYREGEGEWKWAGNGSGQVVISGVEVGHTYKVRARIKDTYGNHSQGVTKSLTIAVRNEIPNTPAGFSVRLADRAYFSWLEVLNADIDYYEIRADMNPGTATGQIARSNNTTADGMLQNRSGTLYLYAHNPVRGYGAPALLSYNLPVPVTPTNVTASSRLGNLQIEFAPIPSGCKGANIYINNKMYFVTTNVFSIAVTPGIYDVTVAYTDMIGEGGRNTAVRTVVEIVIPPEYIDQESLGINKMNTAIADLDKRAAGLTEQFDSMVNTIDQRIVTGAQTALAGDIKTINTRITQLGNVIDSEVEDKLGEVDSRITQLSDSIDSVVNDKIANVNTRITQLGDTIDSQVSDLNTDISSRITQLTDTVNISVRNINNSLNNKTDNNKIISQINLSNETIKIDSKFLHITGTTQFDDNVIVGRMIQANAVTADKLSVDSLSAICATIGTLRTKTSGARTEIKDNLIEVYDANNRLRVRMGIW